MESWGAICAAVLTCIVALALAAFLFWRIWFLRKPARTVPRSGIVSPASGTVVRIIPFTGGAPQQVPKGLLGVVRMLTVDVAKEGVLVVIMLTPMDVHYQRAPVDGTVKRVRYTRGKFANAVSGAARLAAFENEKNEILISSGKGSVKVVQVAGALARRIECYVKEGQAVKKGEIIGLINLGSQVCLVMPARTVLVREGQRVIDGETVIAR